MRTNVYVDGFNLYYSCLKDTPYKWLDLLTLSACIPPESDPPHSILHGAGPGYGG